MLDAASRRGSLALLVLCGLLVAGLSHASERETRLQAVQKRETSLRPAGGTGGLHPAGRDTVFRQAEVPAGKLQETRRLLDELKARETPQRDIVIELPADVLFDFDKSTLRPDALPVLERAARLLEGYPQAPVRIQGHTDSKGSDAYNNALSMRRAQTVAAHLQQAGPVRQFAVVGYGESRPAVPNAHPDGSDDPAGRQRNRRVEIVIGAQAPGATATTSADREPATRLQSSGVTH